MSGLVHIRGTLGRYENAVAYLASNGTTVARRKDAMAERESAGGELSACLREAVDISDGLLSALKDLRDEVIASGNWDAKDFGWAPVRAKVIAAIARAEK